MKNNLKFSVLSIIAFLSLTACSSDDTPAPVNEEEVITTVKVTLMSTSQNIVLTSKDLDGEGPNAPVFTSTGGNLVAGSSYVGTVQFLNELVSPAEDITVEVEEEGASHQVFYQLPTSLGTITYDAMNVDANGKPIGVKFNLVAGSAATTGNLIVKLKHLPNKSAGGVSSGDITNAGGSTDAEAILPITID